MTKGKKEAIKKNSSLTIGLIIVMGVILIALMGILLVQEINNSKDRNKLMDSFREQLNSKELSIIYLTGEGCPYCEIQTPILKQVAEDYNVDYLEVEKTKLNDKQLKEVIESLKLQDASTPTTAIVKGGKLVATRVGLSEGHSYVDFLIRHGVLKEGSVYKPEQYLTFIDYTKFEELRVSEEPVAVVIGGTNCPYCATAKPILSNISHAYEIDINYLTFDRISKEEQNKLFDVLKEMEYKDTTFTEKDTISTPALIVIKDGKITGHMTGLTNVTEYVKFLKEQKVIKE